MIELLIIIFAVAMDQIVKLAVVSTMSLGQSIPLWQDVFHLTYVHNDGAAFSMMSGNMVTFYIITPIALFAFSWYMWKIKQEKVDGKLSFLQKFEIITIAMIMGGTIGNFIDRVSHQYVIDMFDFCLINFAIFNVADIFLTVGTFLLVIALIYEIVTEYKAEKQKKQQNNSQGE
ncbi:MAG: signal peptidase II [Bacillota bacterium]